MDLMNVMKALADETRLRILNILKGGDLCVCEIEVLLNINQSNASRHLNRLTSARILEYYKKAQYVYYKIDNNIIKEHPFINEILQSEAAKIEKCRSDYERLNKYRNSGITCDDLKCGKLPFND